MQPLWKVGVFTKEDVGWIETFLNKQADTGYGLHNIVVVENKILILCKNPTGRPMRD